MISSGIDVYFFKENNILKSVLLCRIFDTEKLVEVSLYKMCDLSKVCLSFLKWSKKTKNEIIYKYKFFKIFALIDSNNVNNNKFVKYLNFTYFCKIENNKNLYILKKNI